MKEQLKEFRESLYAAGMKRAAMPKTWNDAFHLLEGFIAGLPEEGKKSNIHRRITMDGYPQI